MEGTAPSSNIFYFSHFLSIMPKTQYQAKPGDVSTTYAFLSTALS